MPHEHQSEAPSFIKIETLRHFNNLVLSASVTDIDIVLILIRHWSITYQPFTDKLTQTSNTLLGILLVELLMRGLALRLLSEKNTGKKTELPSTISGLLDYFNETLWLYSKPGINDDVQLLTIERETFPALDLISPKQLKTYFAGKNLDVAIEPASLTERLPMTKALTLSRFASAYEVKQLNAMRNGNSKTKAFGFAEGVLDTFSEWKGINFEIAYQESKTLEGKIAFLFDKVEVLQLTVEVQHSINMNNFLKNSLKRVNNKEISKTLNLFEEQLLLIISLLTKFIKQLDEPQSSVNLKIPAFLSNNSDLSLKVAVREYINKTSAFFILLERNYKLKLAAISELPLAELDNPHLENLMGPTLKNLLPLPSILQVGVSVADGGMFKLKNNSQTREVTKVNLIDNVRQLY